MAIHARRVYFFAVLAIILLSGCAGVKPKLEEPSVKVANIKLLPMQGFVQPIQVDLLISNPNDRDLSLRGIAYTVGIENFDVLSGVENRLPILPSYQETPVSVVVSANLIQILQLAQHMSGRNAVNNINYNFTAKLDFSAWLPSYTVTEKGVFSLSSLAQ
jgi:LEA14-like dessication related protein